MKKIKYLKFNLVVGFFCYFMCSQSFAEISLGNNVSIINDRAFLNQLKKDSVFDFPLEVSMPTARGPRLTRTYYIDFFQARQKETKRVPLDTLPEEIRSFFEAKPQTIEKAFQLPDVDLASQILEMTPALIGYRVSEIVDGSRMFDRFTLSQLPPSEWDAIETAPTTTRIEEYYKPSFVDQNGKHYSLVPGRLKRKQEEVPAPRKVTIAGEVTKIEIKPNLTGIMFKTTPTTERVGDIMTETQSYVEINLSPINQAERDRLQKMAEGMIYH